MTQISEHIYCDAYIASLKLEGRVLASPYRDYPYLIIKNFLSQESCRAIVDSIKAANDATKAKVKMFANGAITYGVDCAIRSTNIYPLEEPFLGLYMSTFANHQKSIEDFFALALTTATQVQALEYRKGDFYIKHSDDSSELIDESGKSVGFIQVAPNRKITTVLFATAHAKNPDAYSFCGGELLFNYLFDKDAIPVKFSPEAGDMIVFPSNPIFSHEVLEVEDGYRLTLVQWHNALLN